MKELQGTFQLNRGEKIHSWYPYLAGFSSEFVREKIKKYGLNSSNKIFDPFCGVGTTLVEAKLNKICSDGVEINPFVSFVAKTKLEMNYDKSALIDCLAILKDLGSGNYKKINYEDQADLLKRVFSKNILMKLLFIKGLIKKTPYKKAQNLFLLCLISILKDVSNCKNFSPYLEMKEVPLEDFDVFGLFIKKAEKMIEDVLTISNSTECRVVTGDARSLNGFKGCYYDLILTSPPYLNNWDYSWITKIELFFLDYVKTNLELTKTLRNKLMKSSTYVLQNIDNEGKVRLPKSDVKDEIEAAIAFLNDQRKRRSSAAKKYDVSVREYFNDVYLILKENFRVLKKGGSCLWVVGDSALYGRHIETDRIIGKIGELVGFEFEGLDFLRKRRATRHSIVLKESVIVLKKT